MKFRSTADKDLARLAPPLREIILAACRDIVDDWGMGKPLTGKLSRFRVYRVGVYRIIYVVRQSSAVEIVAIGHRKDIYERVMK